MAALQNMMIMPDGGKSYAVTCIVNEIVHGGEFTLCGRAIPDSNLETHGFEAVGDEFKGPIRKCTCPDCNKVVNYYKHLK